MCSYTTVYTLLNVSVLKATTEKETSSVTTHFKKLTTGNNVFNSHILQFFTKMFNMTVLLPQDAFFKCVEVVLFSVAAFKTLTCHKVALRDT